MTEGDGAWTPAFAGQRRPFEVGNREGMKSATHGAYAVLQLRPRAGELAGELRTQMGELYQPQFEGAIAAAAMVGARLERAHSALEDATDATELRRLDQDCRGWLRLWLHALGTLGLTPAAAAKLGLDVARTRAQRRRAELDAHLEHIEDET